jgi:hypothetical protein
MSENESGGAAPGPEGSAQTQVTQEPTSGGKDTVKYDTYNRVLGEKKKLQSEYESLKEKVTTLEQGQLQSEGKKDELIESLRKQNAEVSGKLSAAVSNFAIGNAKQALAEQANKLGCNDLGLLSKAVEDKLTTIDYDDGFNPNSDQVRMLLDEAKNSHPLLFSKSAPTLGSHQLNPNATVDPDKKSLKDLSKEELYAQFGEALKQK